MNNINRLDLNFTLSTRSERSAYVDNYIKQPQFVSNPLTAKELETIANYLLWGKDDVTGLNGRQEGLNLVSKNSVWGTPKRSESLEALIESPTFNEASIRPLDAYRLKAPLPTFDREEELQRAPDHVKPVLTDLYRRIDETDMAVALYEQDHDGKAVRPKLAAKFGEDDTERLRELSRTWSQYAYLKQKRNIVKLRREQYSIRDTYAEPRQRPQYTPVTEPPDPLDFGSGIVVKPLGIFTDAPIMAYVFAPRDLLCPSRLMGEGDEAAVDRITRYYWSQKEAPPGNCRQVIDLTNPEHWNKIIWLFADLRDAAEASHHVMSQLPFFIKTIEYYIEYADLDECAKEMLRLRMSGHTCEQIMQYTMTKYGKYTNTSYISTIFTHQILPALVNAVKDHEAHIANLPFPEQFRVCSKCGKELLRETDYGWRCKAKGTYLSFCRKCNSARSLLPREESLCKKKT